MGKTRRHAVSRFGADDGAPHCCGRIIRRVVVGSGLIAMGLACHARASRPAWTDGSTHREGFVSIPGGRLHYLDWGGTGPNLVLIHGLGDSPHIFDDLVPALSGQFRVVAYARRGHGRSLKTGPFDTPTLVADLVALMDSLGIEKTHLAGWSMGGNEVTAMAGSHPERVGRIVYLDAGYDWADPMFAGAGKEAPFSLSPPAEARASLDAFRRWRMTWWPALTDTARVEAFMRDLVDVRSDGAVDLATDDSVSNALVGALLTSSRDYRKVKAPALAIYATSWFDVHNGDSARVVAIRAWEEKHMKPFRTASRERIAREISTISTLTVPGTHPDFVFTSRDQVASAIVTFLTAR